MTSQYLSQFDLAPQFDEAEFRHWFLPRPTIVDSYVVVSGAMEITGRWRSVVVDGRSGVQWVPDQNTIVIAVVSGQTMICFRHAYYTL